MQSKLKEARTSQGLTQENVSRKADIPVSLLSRIENGARCNQPTARKIADALNENPESVFPNFSSLRSY